VAANRKKIYAELLIHCRLYRKKKSLKESYIGLVAPTMGSIKISPYPPARPMAVKWLKIKS
jgi:hypothetical protein